ncbi:protein max-like isoform X1 [Diadema antillarum]|uniref:protein max-like isoform X1 n=1 Tax=Diadema antillarum TaxID=105358 RepID=UPI003A839A36
MSDDERDIDVESDEDGIESEQDHRSQAEKRAHHNALERKRRDHIKDSFSMLRDSVPNLHGEKASRAQILNKATEYIQFMRRKNNSHQSDIDDLKKQNQTLEQQIRILERATTGELGKTNGVLMATNRKGGPVSAFDGGSDSDTDSSEATDKASHKARSKRLKTGDASDSGSKSHKVASDTQKR